MSMNNKVRKVNTTFLNRLTFEPITLFKSFTSISHPLE